jgi:mannonate dehydratase
MRPGFGQFNVATPEFLHFAAQFGATDVLLNTPLLPGASRWELHDLVKLRLSVEQYGLKLTALENVPTAFYDHIMLNGPRRDQQIENMIVTVRNIARAGIPIFATTGCPHTCGGLRRRSSAAEPSQPPSTTTLHSGCP